MITQRAGALGLDDVRMKLVLVAESYSESTLRAAEVRMSSGAKSREDTVYEVISCSAYEVLGDNR